MRELNNDCAGIGKEQHLPHRVEQYDNAARAAIIAEFERRKRKEGITLRPGKNLRGEGHAFFQADRDYFLKPLPEKGLVEVSAFDRYDEALLDFDGRIDYECYYDWWYLDEGLEPVQGFTRPINDSLSNRRIFKQKFEALQENAAQVLRGNPRKSAKNRGACSGNDTNEADTARLAEGTVLAETGTRRLEPKPASSAAGSERRSESPYSATEQSRDDHKPL